ncbi:MAG TPA: hypothetical protein VNH44_08415, partial [Micropepsaceae bacterium]|nr:hypothetical protein [Micropepsaceae bacterium]
RLHGERDRIEDLATRLDEAATHAAETLAGRTAQLKTIIQDAGGELKAAGQTLDAQVAQFRDAAETAARAPQTAAVELDRQAKEIEAVGEAAAARAEFVLARQERQRVAMVELLARLKEESEAFEAAILAQRNGVEQAANVLNSEAHRLDEITATGLRRLEAALVHAGTAFSDQNQRLDEIAAAGVRRLEAALAQTGTAFADQNQRVDEIAAAGVRRLEVALAQTGTAFADQNQRVDELAAAGLRRLESALIQAGEAFAGHTQRLDGITEAELRRIEAALVHAQTAFTNQTQRLDEITDAGLRRLDESMEKAAMRSMQLASGFSGDADRVKDVSDSAAASITRLVESLREAATSAHALFADSTESARRRSIAFVGDAMAQCDSLLRAVGAVAEETEKARAALARATAEAQSHIVALPGVAQQEAQRIREAVRAETEAMLDMSARAITTLQARSSRRREPEPPIALPDETVPAPETASEGLRGLARRIVSPKRRAEPRKMEAPKGGYELSAVLAAADAGTKTGLRPGAAAALAALQAALADLAGDLEELAGETADPALWRRYVDGDRGVFARRLAASIGPESVNRITDLYRENPRFHASADTYMAEFEAMLARAREGDRDGFLASTLLTADTGKIYLAIAYALGRLE